MALIGIFATRNITE
ncbi:hypothetical protein YPPY54_4669, partial [Yersinia pestis PY-54]